MSDWHALEDSELGNELLIAVHTSVPGGNNNADPTPIPWTQAVVEYTIYSRGSTTSRVPNLGAEQTDLDNGDIYETIVSVRSSAVDTPAQRLAAVQARAGEVQTEVGAFLANALKYWGGNGTAT